MKSSATCEKSFASAARLNASLLMSSSCASRVISSTAASAFESGQCFFALAGVLFELLLVDARHLAAHHEVDLRDVEAALLLAQVDDGLGVERLRRVLGHPEDQRERHREAAGMGGGE